MRSLLALLSILSLTNSFSQTYCLMVDQNNGWQEYLGTFDISSGSMNQISVSTTSTFVNNGTSPVIDPVNRKYIYSSSNPGPVKIIDLDNGNVVNSFDYSTGFFPHHFAYNELDSTIYCLMVDQDNGWQEYLGTFDISSGSMNQISVSTTSTFVNNGTSPVIDPINRKYIYSSSGPVKIIDLDNGNVVNSFNYSTGFSPRHFAYNELDSTVYCLMVDQNNGYQEYLGTFDITSGSMNQISGSYISTSVNNGTSPAIDPVNRKFIYSSGNPGPVKIIDLDNGNVVNSFNYNTGFFPHHFVYINNKWTGISEENNTLTLGFYPNPASNQIAIYTNVDIYEINILDITGKKIRVINQNTSAINVSDLSNGTYFIKLITDKKIIIKKFVKQ